MFSSISFLISVLVLSAAGFLLAYCNYKKRRVKPRSVCSSTLDSFQHLMELQPVPLASICRSYRSSLHVWFLPAFILQACCAGFLLKPCSCCLCCCVAAKHRSVTADEELSIDAKMLQHHRYVFMRGIWGKLQQLSFIKNRLLLRREDVWCIRQELFSFESASQEVLVLAVM